MTAQIETLEEILAYSEPDNPWLKLYFDRVRFGNGRLGRYNRIVEGTGDPGVAILPLSCKGIGFVKQFRYAVGEELWEIPRGYGNTADSEREARRELLEETGLMAEKMTRLNEIFPNSAVLTTRITLFAAQCGTDRDMSTIDTNEMCEFRWFSVEQAMSSIENGGIRDAITLSAVLSAKVRSLI